MSYIAWHFLNSDKKLGYGDGRTVEAGKTYRTIWPWREYDSPTLCEAGMHGSLRAIDALTYAGGAIICQTVIHGRVVLGDDKLVGDSRQVLWMADATEVLFEFACWVAEEALKARQAEGHKIHQASWDAIQARRDYQAGKITDRQLSAAAAAAWSAAEAAAEVAAWSAAEAAARTVAWSEAESVARAVAWSAHNEELEKRLLALRN